MKHSFIIFSLMMFSLLAKSQKVPKVTATDVAEAKAHPQCSGGNLEVDLTPMPENTSDDAKIASYMRQFRAWRDNNVPKGANVLIHINGERIKRDCKIRDVTPDHFQIEIVGTGEGIGSHCLSYKNIVSINYDRNNLHIYATE